MKRSAAQEFSFQLVSLLIAIIVVHTLYVTWIRPSADAAIQQQMVLQEQGQPAPSQRHITVVIRDFEQEACFILFLWVSAIMGYKAYTAALERRMLTMPLLRVPDGVNILPEDTEEFSRPIQQLPSSQQQLLVPRALMAALRRFQSTRNIADANNAVKDVCDSEAERLDSELAMVRYIAWAIPSIGFIGTVRGIGEALGQAHKAIEGDIAGVTVSLGVAFNSTFVALVISILVMFLSHQLQLLQERQVMDAHTYCDDRVLRHLRAP